MTGAPRNGFLTFTSLYLLLCQLGHAIDDDVIDLIRWVGILCVLFLKEVRVQRTHPVDLDDLPFNLF